MYSYNDFERLFLRYKLEGVPSGVSIEQFCLAQKVPYNLFQKWYKDTRKKIIPVQVLGAPPIDKDSVEAPVPVQDPLIQSVLQSFRMQGFVYCWISV